MVTPDIVFRADATSQLGGGHVMRCLSLAAALRERGARVTFVCNEESSRIVPQLGRSGLPIVQVRAGDLSPPAEISGAKWAVLDHYDFDESADRAWHRVAGKVAVIADHADRRRGCDLLVHPSLGYSSAEFRAMAGEAMVLCGPRYAIMRREFREVRSVALARRDGRAVRRVLISTGMTDVHGASLPCIDIVRRVCPEASVDVVIGPGSPSRSAIEKRAARDERVALHVDPPFISPFLAEADVAIGALGTTTFERFALGLPTVALVLADNQRANARAVEELALGPSVDWADPDAPQRIETALRQLVASPFERRSLASRVCGQTDGNGAGLVADAIFKASRAPELIIRPATDEDGADIWAWRNDPASRAGSLDQDEIAFSSHLSWYRRGLGSAERRFLIGVLGSPFGYVRLDRIEDRHWRVSIALAAERRGTGHGKILLVAALGVFAREQSSPVILAAEILVENQASVRIFLHAGFTIVGERDGVLHLVWRSQDSGDQASLGSNFQRGVRNAHNSDR